MNNESELSVRQRQRGRSRPSPSRPSTATASCAARRTAPRSAPTGSCDPDELPLDRPHRHRRPLPFVPPADPELLRHLRLRGARIPAMPGTTSFPSAAVTTGGRSPTATSSSPTTRRGTTSPGRCRATTTIRPRPAIRGWRKSPSRPVRKAWCAEAACAARSSSISPSRSTVVHNCHCSRCRRARAAAHTRPTGWRRWTRSDFVRGEGHLKSYKLPDARFFTQVFCDVCGSKMPRIDPDRGIAIVPLGALDDDPGMKAADHIFVAEQVRVARHHRRVCRCSEEGPAAV